MELRPLLERLKRPEVVLGILLVLGFLIRIHGLDASSLWHDETVTANAATSLLQNGVPDFPSGFEYWRSFPHTLLVAVSAFFFGSSDFALRLPSVIIGLATIALTYFVGRELYSQRVGLVGASLMTFSGFHIAWSTQARMYITLQLLYLSSVYLIYRFRESFSGRKLLLLSLTIMLAMATHVTAYLLPVVAAVYFFYVRKPQLKSNILLLILLLGAAGFAEVFHFSYLNLIERLVLAPFNAWLYFDWAVSSLPVLTVLGVTGAAVNLREDISTGVLTSISVFPAAYVFLFHVSGSAPRYLFFALPFLCLWTALAADFASGSIPDSSTAFKLLSTLIIVGVAASSYTAAGSYSPSIDHESAYEHIKKSSTGNETLITQWSAPAVHYYRSPDYVLFSGRFNYSDYSYKGIDRYSGAIFITDSAELKNVMKESGDGWLVLSAAAYRFQDEETRKVIDSMNLRFETETLRVWHWNRSKSAFQAPNQPE